MLIGLQCLNRFPRLGQPLQRSQRQSRRTFSDTRAAQTPEKSEPSLSDQVRLLMRRVPYPVAIITATDPHIGNSDSDCAVEKAFRGMTVSSFSTVTLNPEPVISFNVKRPSETLTALQSSGRFLVHLLAPTQGPAALARDFSKGNHNLSIASGEGDFEFASHNSSNNGDGGNSRLLPLPLLRRRNTQEHVDFPFVFECKLYPHQMEVYDHTIVLGHIVRTIIQCPLNNGNKAGSGKDLCLTYADTRFWEMGHEI